MSSSINEIMIRCLKGIKTIAYPKRTICEIHREIWDIIEEVKDTKTQKELQARVIIAYDMGKRMENKLREYKKNWDKDFWEENKDFEQDKIRRKNRK